MSIEGRSAIFTRVSGTENISKILNILQKYRNARQKDNHSFIFSLLFSINKHAILVKNTTSLLLSYCTIVCIDGDI